MKYKDLYQKIILTEQLKKRKEVNKNYSIRAYSRDLGISPSIISRVLAGKSLLSPKTAIKVSLNLKLNEDEHNKFLENSNFLDNKGIKPVKQLLSIDINTNPYLVTDWTYYAIIDLLRLKNAKSDISWISTKLGIKPLKTRRCIEKLLDVGLLQYDKNRYIPIDAHLSAESESKPNLILQKAQEESMLIAIQKQKVVKREYRELRCTTMAMNMKRLPEIRELLKKFLHEVTSLAEEGETSEVYQLGVQLIPLSNIE